MSIEMMTLVWRHSRNKGSVLLMELAIADHAHDDGTGAYPSTERLARYARQTERNVRFVLQQLLDSKEVSIEYNAGPRGTNRFTLNTKLLRSLPDQIPNREGERVSSQGEKISSGEKISPLKKSARGGKSSVKGGKNRVEGGKNRHCSTTTDKFRDPYATRATI